MLFVSCEDVLEEEPFSQFSASNFLVTEGGMTSLLNSAYSNVQYNSFPGNDKIYLEEYPTDILWETGGGLNRSAVIFINYNWDGTHGWIQNTAWRKPYRAIRDANYLLDNIENAEMSDQLRERYIAEARFIRATAYTYLHNWFGPTPLVVSSNTTEFEVPRSSEEEFNAFVEEELRAAADVLPEVQEDYGRATRGAALGILGKYLLNTKQWQKAADVSQEVIDLGIYSLFPDYTAMFAVDNEMNNEYIFVHPAAPQAGFGNVYMPSSYPPKYPIPSNHENWAAQNRLYDDFVNSFEEGDQRREPILTEYVDTDGNTVMLLGDDNSRSFKYVPDPNASGRWTGNDIPEIRYADILLTRAEALNELNGPNQESVDLINMVRERAGVSLLNLSDFGSTESLRDHILQERGWEFYTEAKRRQDLVRHGKLISNAQARGKNAQAHHVRFPIPQSEMDVNSKLNQNSGY